MQAITREQFMWSVLALSEAVAYARRHCDFLLHTGDLIDFVSESNLDIAKRLLPGGNFSFLGQKVSVT